ncbi:EAL domain-containing protein [Devosia sp. A8/3-2]|nr:EAL domain-containing protein [Devosia sp. A8/3-2]
MQALVYTFIGFAAVGIGAIAYFGLTFTPAEAILAAVVFGCVCVVLLERSLRQRAERRLEKAIEDLSRLLATDARAGAVPGQRINALTDLDAGGASKASRPIFPFWAPSSAESPKPLPKSRNAPPDPTPRRPIGTAPQPTTIREPIIPLDTLRRSVAENRLIYHVQPIVTLPQRRPQGYDLMPRLMLEDGDLADSADFMPSRGGDDVLTQIEAIGPVEAITIARRARTGGQPVNLYIPLSRATLGNAEGFGQLMATLEANRAIAAALSFRINAAQWQSLTIGERAIADAIAKKASASRSQASPPCASISPNSPPVVSAPCASMPPASSSAPRISPTITPPTSPIISPASTSPFWPPALPARPRSSNCSIPASPRSRAPTSPARAPFAPTS